VGRSRQTGGSSSSPQVYRFNLAQITDISIALSQATGSGFLKLYFDDNLDGKFNDNKNRTIALGAASESFNGAISSEVLPAIGTYFITVDGGSSDSSIVYDLTVTASPLFPSSLPTDPGSEPTTAYNLGTLNKGGSFEVKDYVGRLDATDIFRFTLPEASKVTSALSFVDNLGYTLTIAAS
jgi:hypothetical protein